LFWNFPKGSVTVALKAGTVPPLRQIPPSMQAVISYDLIMEEDMPFAEGTFRLPGEDWRIFIVARYDVPNPEIVQQHWDSGVSGLLIRFPISYRLSRETIEGLLSRELEVSKWLEVRGPDSMNLR
jgi:hypothetical protein